MIEIEVCSKYGLPNECKFQKEDERGKPIIDCHGMLPLCVDPKNCDVGDDRMEKALGLLQNIQTTKVSKAP